MYQLERKTHMQTRTVRSILLVATAVLLPGCEQRSTNQASEPFEYDEYDYVLAVVLDLSGSFEPYMQADNPYAYRFFARLADKFFRQRMGYNDRILLTQLSTGDRPLLWEGPPDALRRRFPDADAFAQFLQTKARPGGSHAYAAVADTLSYLTTRPGINKNTTVLTVVLSDLMDNDPDADEAKRRLLDSLRSYSDRGGHIGLYWVDQTAVDEWSRLLVDTGLPPRVWIDIIDDPELPDFDR